jgi:hypothetical protein
MLVTIIFNRVLHTTYEHICESQYGFTKGVSLHYQHLDIQKFIFDALNFVKVLAIDLIFLDFEKAFERILISLLMQKKGKYNIDVNLLLIIKDMLSQRIQYVNFNDSKSNFYDVDSGVSHGGISSPHYFNLFVNYLSHSLI